MPAPTSSRDDDLVIDLRNVSLCYRLAKQHVFSFKEYLIHMARGSLSYRKLWAVQDLTLTVRRGEEVGIVGSNGAGKSTLAKVISGVLKPTKGTRIVHGRISPILELGTGFDFELTGLENIYLNGLFLGYRRKEIDTRKDSIVDFSGLGEFIDSPVRNYSTGMLARLGFSIATAWQPDLLVLDEVLAVGDARFLERCHERLDQYRKAGTTILIISHTPNEILGHCHRCLWIDQGRLRADGQPQEILDLYLDRNRDRGGAVKPSEETATFLATGPAT